MDSYLERYPVFTDYPHQSLSLPYTDACMQSVAAIKARCEAAGINLVVVAGPVYAEYLQNYQAEDVAQFYQALAAVTPYWDFSSSSVSCEPRYFYDGTHFRNNVGEMMCARIAGRTDLWMPDDFGTYVTADTPANYFTDVLQPTALTDSAISTRVPILMYHHLAEDVTNDEMVSPEQFEAQIRALSEAGYTGVSFDELQAYVLRGEPLPKKPVVITFDDGYLSNYTLAYPAEIRHESDDLLDRRLIRQGSLQGYGLCHDAALRRGGSGRDGRLRPYLHPEPHLRHAPVAAV